MFRARTLLPFLVSLLALAPAPAHANCNLIPVAADEFRSVGGTVSNTIVAPGNPVEIRIDLACHPGARGFEPVAANNEVVLRFTPPAPGDGAGPVTEVVIPGAALSVANCGLGGGRCDTLRVSIPDAETLDAALAPPGDGLGPAGPAELVVRAPDATEIARIGPLFEPTLACDDRQPEAVFGHFTVLPPPNVFADLASGAVTDVRATLDGYGNLLIPFDYAGVLPAGPGAALFRILQGTADVDAFGAQPGLPIRVPAATWVRSFSLSGRPIPPVLEVDEGGAMVLGSVDARLSVIRLSRRDPFTNAGDPLFDLSDRLSQGGRGPIVIANVSVGAGVSAPLASLSADAAGITFARSEAFEGLDLNGDGDEFDSVAHVVDVGSGAAFSPGLALTQVPAAEYAKPALATGGGLAAFSASEARQGRTTLNGDGDVMDGLLRVFATRGVELTAGLPPTPVDPAPEIEGAPIAVSGGLVFFRTREADAAVRHTELLSPTLQNEEQRGDSQSPSVSRDGRYVAFDSFGGPTFLDGAPLGNHVYVLDRQTGTYELISRRTDGTPLAPSNFRPRISADGRVVAFLSRDDSFPGAEDGGFADAFVFDRDTRELTLIPAADSGDVQPDDISDDGRYVLLNGARIYDRQTGTFRFVLKEVEPPNPDLVWVPLAGRGSMSGDARFVAAPVRAEHPGNGVAFEGVVIFDLVDSSWSWCGPGSAEPELSGDGRWVAFQSAGLLVADDNNLAVDVFVSNVPQCNEPVRISVDTEGRETSGGLSIRETVLSDDGRFVAFVFDGDGLVPGVPPGGRQAYRYDRWTQVVEAISVAENGAFANAFVNDIAISGDGRVVAFSSFATNLAPGTSGDLQHVFARTEDGAPSLNGGDADASDTVLQVFDPAAQPPALRPAARVPAQAVAVDGGRAAFLSSEAADGGVDRNGDGDAADLVARVYDGIADQLRELGIAASRIDIAGDTVCLTVPESQESDPAFRNDDADADDDVVAVWSLAAGGRPTSLGVSAVAVQAAEGRCVFATLESDEGGAILNGDGDADDTVLRWWDGAAIRETGLAVVDFVTAGSLVAFRVGEMAQDEVLNGDGDYFELVMHVLDLASGEVTNTQRAADRCEISGCDPFFEPYRVGTHTVSFLTEEIDQSGFGPSGRLGAGCRRAAEFDSACDLNDDGDRLDVLITVFNVRSGKAQVITLGDDGPPAPQPAPPFPTEQSGRTVLQVVVPESSTGEDVNGDGQITDDLVLVLIGDTDNDGTLDVDATGQRDTCVETPNPTQVDADRDRLGDDACDPAPTPVLPGDLPCDVDLDGVIDADDVALVFGDRGMATRGSDPRDPDGDGVVSVLDVSLCSRACTFADCAAAPPVAARSCGLLGAEAAPLLGLLGAWRRRATRRRNAASRASAV